MIALYWKFKIVQGRINKEWKQYAKKLQISVSAFIRLAVNAYIKQINK